MCAFIPALCSRASLCRCCVLLCFLFCVAFIALLHAKVGILCASFPDLPPFFPLFGLLVFCPFPVVCSGQLSLFPPSFPPFRVCVCVCRESKIEKGKVTKSVRWQNLHAKPVEIFFRFDSVHVALTQKVIVCMRVCVNCVQTTSYHAEESRS